jgi:hypothetical protein
MSTRRLRPGLIAIWLVLAGLVVVIAARQDGETPDARESVIPLLAVGEDALGSIEVLHQARRAAVSRDAEGRWFVHAADHSHAGGAVQADETHRAAPEAAATLAARVAATAALTVRRAEGTAKAEDVGVGNPKTIVAFYGRAAGEIDYGSPLAMLYVGDHAPALAAYYATIDDDQTITLIGDKALSALIELLFSQ